MGKHYICVATPMKKLISFIACIVISAVLLQYRVANSDLTTGAPPLKVTIWDAFGYYVYLPSICIYHDYKKLDWLAEIDKKYKVTGGDGYQAEKLDNGNYTFKYLGGVAIMETPFFLVGHFIAKHSHYPPDGFSPPYQYALGFGVIFYCILAIFLLRKILLLYFSDLTTGITLIMVCLATNFVQYAAVDNGQSHGYIFPLYVLVLYATVRWHARPAAGWALLIGYLIGLGMICRPTEAIMLFIPLLWNTHNREAAKQKWGLVKQHKSQLLFVALGGIGGILPQLIYWKITTGSFIFDVGSKWDFLNPHFRVLFGWEKGWFIYTPVALFFIAGMFFMKQLPFKKSVLWFCLLNIYIIIAWSEWRYGGSYSTRALVQSYPSFALPMAAITERINLTRWRWAFYVVCGYLLFVNLFQVNQYNRTILHYDDMNRKYYGRIYLNAHPTPLDMSLLDNNEILNDESEYRSKVILSSDSVVHVRADAGAPLVLFQGFSLGMSDEKRWLKVEANINSPSFWQSYINVELKLGDSVKHTRERLFNAISPDGNTNEYIFYMSIPAAVKCDDLKLYISDPFPFDGDIHKIAVTELDK